LGKIGNLGQGFPAHFERGSLMGGYEIIMGYQSQGGRQNLNRIITFKKYSPVVHQNGSVDFPSCLVEIS
jgi:hypothetical protein